MEELPRETYQKHSETLNYELHKFVFLDFFHNSTALQLFKSVYVFFWGWGYFFNNKT